VLYEDDAYFFVHKPAGITVAGDDSATFHDAVKRHARINYGLDHLNLLHRLDKGTSGIMVYAKSLDAARHYARLQERRGAITKDYVAVVGGTVPKAAGRVAGGICLSRDRTSYVVRGKKSGKSVLTTYKRLVVAEHPRLGTVTSLSLRLFTGRKHQIRASCRHLGAPIVGDTRYGGMPYGTMLLHASRNSFVGMDRQYNVSVQPKWASPSDPSAMDDAGDHDEEAFFARLLHEPPRVRE
jgi:23S rRNA-/tRNA-specific pseudouridylate synthase